MGPDGGINGGRIIAEGSPEKITGNSPNFCNSGKYGSSYRT